MTKNLQFKSVDLLKYTENVIDKQPTQAEITRIVNSYVTALQPTHLAIEIPLDSNAYFLAHGHVSAPLTIDEFTRIWITAIHAAGVNVYFRGTFCGIKNLYDFNYDKTTPLGTVDTAITDNSSTWLGRYYQWLNTNLGYLQPGDILGVLPQPTNNAFNGNFFIHAETEEKIQTNFLAFYTDMKKLSDEMTKAIVPLYTGFSSQVYRDILNGWIPAFMHDLVGVMVVDYYGDEQTPQEMEKALNELYSAFRHPIFLSEWQMPKTSILSPTVDNNPQEFFEAFTRLRDKGILIGLNYFDGLDFNEGVFTGDDLNSVGQLLGGFFAQGVPPAQVFSTKPTPVQKKKIVIKKKSLPKLLKEIHAIRKSSQSLFEPEEEHRRPPKPHTYRLRWYDYLVFAQIAIYGLLGADFAIGTSLLFHISFGILIAYLTMVYTLLIAVVHAVFDGA